MPSSLSTTAEISVRRVLDGAARRLLAERLASDLVTDHDPPGKRAVGKASDHGAHNTV